MKLKEFFKIYLDLDEDLTTGDLAIVDDIYRCNTVKTTKETGTLTDFYKALKWNLDRYCYYRDVYTTSDNGEVCFSISTGKLDFYCTIDSPDSFLRKFLKRGLRKDRDYTKPSFPEKGIVYYFYTDRKKPNIKS